MIIKCFLIFILLYPVTNFAQDWTSFTVDIKKMKEVLTQVKNIDSLPQFQRLANFAEFEMEACQLEQDEEILALYNELNNAFFAKIKIPLFRCKWTHGTGTFLNKGIFLSNYEVEYHANTTSHANYIASLKFTLAHELAHFVHELTTMQPLSYKENYSINGYPSYTLDEYKVCNMLDQADDQTDCTLNLWYFGHSEVDIYAALILQQLGFQDWKAVELEWKTLALNLLKDKSTYTQNKHLMRLTQRMKIIKDAVSSN